MKEKSNIFSLSEKYQNKMYKDIVLNELLTIVFYFVFNILFQDHPNYGILKHLFAYIFIGLGILLLFLGKKRADKAIKTYYKVSKKGLEYFDGKDKTFYPWDSFIEVKRNPNLISRIYPYEFVTKEGTFTLHRQLDRPDELIPIILEHTNLKAEMF